jgi:hypothetical protein
MTEGVVRGQRGHVTWRQALQCPGPGQWQWVLCGGRAQARMRTVRAAIPGLPASAAGPQGKMRAPSRTILIPEPLLPVELGTRGKMC